MLESSLLILVVAKSEFKSMLSGPQVAVQAQHGLYALGVISGGCWP